MIRVVGPLLIALKTMKFGPRFLLRLSAISLRLTIRYGRGRGMTLPCRSGLTCLCFILRCGRLCRLLGVISFLLIVCRALLSVLGRLVSRIRKLPLVRRCRRRLWCFMLPCLIVRLSCLPLLLGVIRVSTVGLRVLICRRRRLMVNACLLCPTWQEL